MQRWWFHDDDKAKDDVTTVNNDRNSEQRRQHTFRVLVNQTLQPWEVIAVSGECNSLGNWLLEHSVKLHCEKGMCDMTVIIYDIYCYYQSNNMAIYLYTCK